MDLRGRKAIPDRKDLRGHRAAKVRAAKRDRWANEGQWENAATRASAAKWDLRGQWVNEDRWVKKDLWENAAKWDAPRQYVNFATRSDIFARLNPANVPARNIGETNGKKPSSEGFLMVK